MTPTEIKGVATALIIVTTVCAWLLVHRVRYHFLMKEIRRQEEVEREEHPPREEIWPWPPRGKYAPPGVWGGPSKALENFLNKRYSTIQVNIKLEGASKAAKQLRQLSRNLRAMGGHIHVNQKGEST